MIYLGGKGIRNSRLLLRRQRPGEVDDELDVQVSVLRREVVLRHAFVDELRKRRVERGGKGVKKRSHPAAVAHTYPEARQTHFSDLEGLSDTLVRDGDIAAVKVLDRALETEQRLAERKVQIHVEVISVAPEAGVGLRLELENDVTRRHARRLL